MPSVLSWDIERVFPHSFEWTGTRDPSDWLSIPTAFQFSDRLGTDAILAHNHRLIRDAMDLLHDAWDLRAGTPDAMIASMVLVPLPEGLPFVPTPDGCPELRRHLWESHRIVASPCFEHEGRLWLRISAQIYNDISDYARLADIINRLRANS